MAEYALTSSENKSLRKVLVEFEKRRRRWLISAQGWSGATTLGQSSTNLLNPVRVRLGMNPFRVKIFLYMVPRVLAALEPWAKISQRLRRFSN